MTTCQGFQITVLTSALREGHGKQLVSPEKTPRSPLWVRRESQADSEHTELASAEGTGQWLQEMWQEADTSQLELI